MKLITLNTWGGNAGEGIIPFFEKYKDVDIFALQEIFHKASDATAWKENYRRELFSEIVTALPDHDGYFAPIAKGEWGLSVFIKKSLKLREQDDFFVHLHANSLVGKDGATAGRNLQYVKLSHNKRKFTILNFHGLWNGKGKTDTEDRINQSKKILEFAKTIPEDIILCGDFNLLPDTDSLKMLEKELRLKNLVKEFGITSTRTSFYEKPIKFADYVLISPGIKVKTFKVLPEEVSDHAALYLEFE